MIHSPEINLTLVIELGIMSVYFFSSKSQTSIHAAIFRDHKTITDIHEISDVLVNIPQEGVHCLSEF